MSLPARTSPVRLLAAAGAALVAAVARRLRPGGQREQRERLRRRPARPPPPAPRSARSLQQGPARDQDDGQADRSRTDKPVYEPWFKDDKPENGQGFECAVAYAVAQKLGYAQGDVTWTRAPFDSVIQPGPKNFDFDINEVSITDKRKQAVDFSSGYYDVTPGHHHASRARKIANAKTHRRPQGRQDRRAGRHDEPRHHQEHRSSRRRDPTCSTRTTTPSRRLENGQIDGLVIDLPTAFFITGAAGQEQHDRRPVRDAGGSPSSSVWSSTRAAR